MKNVNAIGYIGKIIQVTKNFFGIPNREVTTDLAGHVGDQDDC